MGLSRMPRDRVTWGCGGMADAHGSGPCVRKDVGVQLPPSPRVPGCPLSAESADRGHSSCLLRGPSPRTPRVAVVRFAAALIRSCQALSGDERSVSVTALCSRLIFVPEELECR